MSEFLSGGKNWERKQAEAHLLAERGQYQEAEALITQAIGEVRRKAGSMQSRTYKTCAQLATGLIEGSIHNAPRPVYKGYAYIAVTMAEATSGKDSDVVRLMSEAENLSRIYMNNLKIMQPNFSWGDAYLIIGPFYEAWMDLRYADNIRPETQHKAQNRAASIERELEQYIK